MIGSTTFIEVDFFVCEGPLAIMIGQPDDWIIVEYITPPATIRIAGRKLCFIIARSSSTTFEVWWYLVGGVL